MRHLVLILALLAWGRAEAADLEAREVAPGVYALVGEMAQRSPENLANNATFGLVETKDGLVLIDPGGSYKGAKALHAAIQKISKAPVLAVINTGGQDHRWLGNGYWKSQGAKTYASSAAAEDQLARADGQLAALRALVGEEGLAGTEPVTAEATFATDLDLTIGGATFQVRHVGQAHTPGDSFVWLPEKGVLFSGDIIYLDRMLGVGQQSNSKSWLDSFAAIEALNPKVIVPGHGYPGSLDKAKAQTRDYLLHLRAEARTLLDAGIGPEDSAKIDQSAFMSLKVSDQIAGRNAQAVFLEMEWE